MIKSDADFFSTGHYIRIKKHHQQYYIFKGIDTVKDQSYFLWNVKSKYLKYWLTPLGDYTKQEIREIAIEHKMGFLAHRKESMGICFIGKEGYQQFIKNHRPQNIKIEQGNIIDQQNTILGTHNGIPYYTIGQKKGLCLNDSKKVVIAINKKENTISVGENTDLEITQFKIRDYYFIDNNDMKNPLLKVWVRGIGKNPKGNCKITAINQLFISIKLDNYAWALAEGQPVAFYIKERLVGGGYICNC